MEKVLSEYEGEKLAMDLGQVFTKSSVADYMVSLLSLSKDSLILDPCFGDGVFLKSLLKAGFKNVEGYEIDSKLYSKSKKKIQINQLYNKDFLFNENPTKYDGIIMNPPYIRQEKIDDMSEFGITKERLKKDKLFGKLPSTANMYMYFIVKSLSMLKDGGEMVVIFPNSWLTSKVGIQFEKLMYENSTLLNEIHLLGELFEKKALVEVLVLRIRKGKYQKNAIFKSYKVVEDIFVDLKKDNQSLNLGFDVEFDNIATVRRGITTGYNKMYINPGFSDDSSQKHLHKIISSPKSVKGYSTVNANLDDIFIPGTDDFFSDEEIKYLNNFKTIIIESKKPKTLLEKIKKNNNNWFKINSIDSIGILFNYFVRKDMKFILNESVLARDNFYIIKPKIDKYLMFALLNNYYTYYQLEKNGKTYGAGLLKLQRYDIENLMFPNLDEFNEEEVEQLIMASRNLSKYGDESEIQTISKIISNHSAVEYSCIVESLDRIKELRLKGEK
ncbi:Eco57I restriction-modification methylase domain-containing protein [Enterococcus lactis]|uniref:Eco57I restriction-modification methylase domain-containing protein n=1 Tax=Enterococcus lactis TaxID=357441 RepID=UPI002412B661|nr:N-6 DNA methylase [Enterococcus lactis]